MKQLYILLACALFISSCSSNITKDITKKYPPLDRNAEVQVIQLQEAPPQAAIQIGTVYVGDSESTKDCSWDNILEKIKREARKAGGNTIKIVTHIPPRTAGSICHQVTAQILKTEFVPNRGVVQNPANTPASSTGTLTPADTVELEYTDFRIAVQGGYSYRVASAPDNMEPFLRDYLNGLKSGYHGSADATYFFTEKYGGGIKFSHSRASNLLSDVVATNSSGNSVRGRLKDDVAVTFIGPSFTERHISSNRLNAFISSVGIGYLNFEQTSEIIDQNIKLTGNTFGLAGDIGYDFGVSSDISVGLQLSYLIGVIKEMQANDGTSTKTLKFSEGGESLNRFDLSIGVRFNK